MRVKIGELTAIRTGKLDANASSLDGKYPFFTCSREPLKIAEYSYDCECVLVAGNGDLNVKYYNGKFDAYQRTYIIEDNSSGRLYMPYLYFFMLRYIEELRKQSIGGVIKYIKLSNLTEAEVELPAIEEQRRIVQILKSAQLVVEKAERQKEYLNALIKARFVEIFEAIKETCNVDYYIKELIAGKSLASEVECKNKVLKTGAVSFDYFDESQIKNLPLNYEPKEEHLVHKGDIIISRMNTAELTGAAAYVWKVSDNVYVPDRLWKAVIRDGVNAIFLWNMLIQPSTKEQIQKVCSGTSGSMKNISKSGMLGIRVKKVDVYLQNKFATFVEEVNKSKVEVKKALDEAQLLFDSLMQKYFG